MKKRQPRSQSSDNDLIVCEVNEKPKSVARRILRALASTVLWLLTLAPGIFIIAYGANGILQKRLAHAGRFKGMTDGVSYGENAVGWGWMFVGVGLWALGQFCALKTGRAGFNFYGWVFAVIAAGIGLCVLLRRFF